MANPTHTLAMLQGKGGECIPALPVCIRSVLPFVKESMWPQVKPWKDPDNWQARELQLEGTDCAAYPSNNVVPEFKSVNIRGGQISIGTELHCSGAYHGKLFMVGIMWVNPRRDIAIIQGWSKIMVVHIHVPFNAINWVVRGLVNPR
ncbi:hypothetical protein C8R46DRAFT_1028989 [Mycena filopes]|nr:hypothetical protein C8R46DRAFT_1028989 [Mycena filopes]